MLVSCIAYRFRIAGIVVASLLDVLIAITLLCVLAYVLGVYYAAHREPRLAGTDNRITVLSVFPAAHVPRQELNPYELTPGKDIQFVRFLERECIARYLNSMASSLGFVFLKSSSTERVQSLTYRARVFAICWNRVWEAVI